MVVKNGGIKNPSLALHSCTSLNETGAGLLGTRGEDSSAAVAAAIARASTGLPYPAKRQAGHGSLTSPGTLIFM